MSNNIQNPVVSAQDLMASMTKEEIMELVLSGAKRKEFKSKLPKAPGHKENLIKLLTEKPMTATDLAKELGTTIKTVQSYICYARKDGIEILQVGGKYRLLDEKTKKALGLA